MTIKLLQEIIARWKATSPKFFKVITTISTILAIITGIPLFLAELGIADIIPPNISVVLVKIVSVATTVAAIISKLTVATPEATKEVLEKK